MSIGPLYLGSEKEKDWEWRPLTPLCWKKLNGEYVLHQWCGSFFVGKILPPYIADPKVPRYCSWLPVPMENVPVQATVEGEVKPKKEPIK